MNVLMIRYRLECNHLGVDPDSEPPRGMLVEGNFVPSDSNCPRRLFRRLDRNIASVFAQSKVTPFSLAQPSPRRRSDGLEVLENVKKECIVRCSVVKMCFRERRL